MRYDRNFSTNFAINRHLVLDIIAPCFIIGILRYYHGWASNNVKYNHKVFMNNKCHILHNIFPSTLLSFIDIGSKALFSSPIISALELGFKELSSPSIQGRTDQSGNSDVDREPGRSPRTRTLKGPRLCSSRKNLCDYEILGSKNSFYIS